MQAVPDALLTHAHHRYKMFASSPLNSLFTPSDTFCDVSNDTIQYLLSNRDALLRWFDDWENQKVIQQQTLQFFTHHTLDYIYQKNQFLSIQPHQQQRLWQVYHAFMSSYREQLAQFTDEEKLWHALSDTQSIHQQRLATFVYELGQVNGDLRFVLSEPTCHFYPPEMQLSMLDITLEDLQEPILDIGCGQDAALVQYLRAQGKIAFGIDRMAEDTDFIRRASWFDIEPEVNSWGTILSHMAFSNHFVHHHLRQDGHPQHYAQYFMTILHALKVGGMFIYTPGVPFIEALLPADQYQVTTRAIENLADFHTTHITVRY